MPRALDAWLLWLAIAALLLLSPHEARAEPKEKLLETIYVSPGVVYSGFDRPNGRHGIGGELSVPIAMKHLVVGPLAQVQWTPRGAHYVAGAEIGINAPFPYALFLELAWFHQEATERRATRQGFSAALLAGMGVVWLGPRLSVSSEGSVSVALNISLKGPIAIFGCNWIRTHMTPQGCRQGTHPL